MNIGENIIEARNKANLTQSQLAALCDVTVTAISRYERGKSAPSIGVLASISAHTGVSADTLLGLRTAPETAYVGLSGRHLRIARDISSLPDPIQQHITAIIQALRSTPS